ncbi:hypothetical protein AHAS_Ahas17G0126600 [Arachis hypogaea]
MCFKLRMSSISSKEVAHAEMSGGNREALFENRPSLLCRGVRRRPVVTCKLPVIPVEELNFEFAIMNEMEEWLIKIFHEARISGEPFDGELFSKDRFSLEEKAAKEDATFEMLGLVLDVTKKEMRDYNYAKEKRFRVANNALPARVAHYRELVVLRPDQKLLPCSACILKHVIGLVEVATNSVNLFMTFRPIFADSRDHAMEDNECLVAANPSVVETKVPSSNAQKDPIVGHASPTDIVADLEEDKSPRLVTEPIVKMRRLF